MVFFFPLLSFQHLHHYNGELFFCSLHCTYGASGRALFFYPGDTANSEMETFGICQGRESREEGILFCGFFWRKHGLETIRLTPRYRRQRYMGVYLGALGLSNGYWKMGFTCSLLFLARTFRSIFEKRPCITYFSFVIFFPYVIFYVLVFLYGFFSEILHYHLHVAASGFGAGVRAVFCSLFRAVQKGES